jgi:uncharacterized protein
MKCPICTNTDLLMSDRSGVEIDYCPQCRGVWLDRGELDKIIERSAQSGSQTTQQPQSHTNTVAPTAHHVTDAAYHQGQSGYGYGHKKHKKENFLQDLFDF